MTDTNKRLVDDTSTKPGMPYANASITKFLSRRIDEIAPRKNQREIASEIGYIKPNIISMFKRGEMKVPLEKIPALAKALEVDPSHLFRLALEQYWPERQQIISEIFGNVVSDNEFAIVTHVRKTSGERDPSLTTELKKKIEEAFER